MDEGFGSRIDATVTPMRALQQGNEQAVADGDG